MEISKKDIQDVLEREKVVTVPDLQIEFSSGYKETRRIIREMEEEGTIRFRGGLEFVAEEKKSVTLEEYLSPRDKTTENDRLIAREREIRLCLRMLEEAFAEIESWSEDRKNFRKEVLKYCRKTRIFSMADFGNYFAISFSKTAKIVGNIADLGALAKIGARYFYRENARFTALCEGKNEDEEEEDDDNDDNDDEEENVGNLFEAADEDNIYGENLFDDDDYDGVLDEDEEDEEDNDDEDEEYEDEDDDFDDKTSFRRFGDEDLRRAAAFRSRGLDKQYDYMQNVSFPPSVARDMEKEYKKRLKFLKDNDGSGDRHLPFGRDFVCLEKFFDGDNVKKYSFSLFRTMKLFETVKEYKKTGRQSAISYAEKQYKKAMKQGESTLAVVYIDLSCRLRMYTDEEFDGMNGGD